jgi:23S rRNA (cytidine1920-2'-O)/16S rRNA (cytidine1409-2'-O)-methyltransferase
MKQMRQRADLVLVARGFFASRARAQAAIAAGLVRVDGAPLGRASQPIAIDAAIEARPAYGWASRGGVKLEAALDHFDLDPMGLDCLDVGVSTGGFTDVLLARGARRVYAIDVGRGQIEPRIANDKRVIAYEGLDARNAAPALFEAPPRAIVCDLSFISLRLVLPNILNLTDRSAWLAALIKPQFEVGRTRLRKGVVKDAGAMKEACDSIAECVKGLGWRSLGVIDSPIAGGDGAKEFLIGARHG